MHLVSTLRVFSLFSLTFALLASSALGEGLDLGGLFKNLPTLDLGSLGSLFGGGKHMDAGFVKHSAHIEESPEIGFGFHKIPIMLPLPTLILRKNKQLVAKGFTMPVSYGPNYGGNYNY